MNTGHEGSLTTIHANTPRDALHRLEMLVLMARRRPAAARRPRADRLGLRPDHPPRPPDRRQPPRQPHHRGVRPRGRRRHAAGPVRHALDSTTTPDTSRTSLLGPLRSTGLRPNFLDKLATHGVELPANAFERGLALTRTAGAAAVVAATSCWWSQARPAGAGQARATALRQVEFSDYPVVAARRARGAEVRRSRRRSSRTDSRCSGLDVQSLGESKAIMLAIDRSKSMHGAPLDQAVGGGEAVPDAEAELGPGRASCRSARRRWRRRGSSSPRSTPTSRCAGSRTDKTEGTALADAVVVSASELDSQDLAGRVLILLTDGRDVRSLASWDEAVRAARRAHVVVYADRARQRRPRARSRISRARPAAPSTRARRRPTSTASTPDRRRAEPHLAHVVHDRGAPGRRDQGRARQQARRPAAWPSCPGRAVLPGRSWLPSCARGRRRRPAAAARGRDARLPRRRARAGAAARGPDQAPRARPHRRRAAARRGEAPAARRSRPLLPALDQRLRGLRRFERVERLVETAALPCRPRRSSSAR